MGASKKKKREPTEWAFVSALMVPIVIVDEKSRKVIHCNPAFDEMSGRSSNEVIGAKIAALFDNKSADRVEALIEIIAANEQQIHIQEIDLDLLRKSRRKTPVNINAFLWEIANRRYICLSLHDISQLRAMHAQQESAQREMAQISKLADIGLLAAGVAHELNNPLMIVQGFAENLDMMLDLPETARSELKMQTAEILKATERMSRIINQMTRIVRSEDVQWAVNDLQELVQGVIRFLAHELRNNNVEVDFQFEPQSLVKCDHSKVEQVLINIINNATHAMEANSGEKRIRIRTLSTLDTVELRVWNNGPPIPARMREKIMSPFFTTKEVGKGTGLGLSVSYGIMKAHNGDLTFTSSEREGTEFRMAFPRPKDQSLESPAMVGTGKSVIIVDDDPPALEILANKIAQFGYKTLKARRAADAFAILKSNPEVVALFSDLRMPEMDGLTLLRQIREYGHTGLMLFAVTGYMLSTQAERELNRLGVSGILKKPLNHTAFAKVMSQLETQPKPQAA